MHNFTCTNYLMYLIKLRSVATADRQSAVIMMLAETCESLQK